MVALNKIKKLTYGDGRPLIAIIAALTLTIFGGLCIFYKLGARDHAVKTHEEYFGM
jgi:hypothetical protein